MRLLRAVMRSAVLGALCLCAAAQPRGYGGPRPPPRESLVGLLKQVRELIPDTTDHSLRVALARGDELVNTTDASDQDMHNAVGQLHKTGRRELMWIQNSKWSFAPPLNGPISATGEFFKVQHPAWPPLPSADAVAAGAAGAAGAADAEVVTDADAGVCRFNLFAGTGGKALSGGAAAEENTHPSTSWARGSVECPVVGGGILNTRRALLRSSHADADAGSSLGVSLNPHAAELERVMAVVEHTLLASGTDRFFAVDAPSGWTDYSHQARQAAKANKKIVDAAAEGGVAAGGGGDGAVKVLAAWRMDGRYTPDFGKTWLHGRMFHRGVARDVAFIMPVVHALTYYLTLQHAHQIHRVAIALDWRDRTFDVTHHTFHPLHSSALTAMTAAATKQGAKQSTKRDLLTTTTGEDQAGQQKAVGWADGEDVEGAANTGRGSQKTELKVLSYNVWNTNPPTWLYHDSSSRFERYMQRMTLLVDNVVASGADVVAFQEVRGERREVEGGGSEGDWE